MEHYDVIIVGAGIAGCGLAHNLERVGFKGSVLVLDKKWLGSNAAYGYRNVPIDTLKEYGFSSDHEFRGLKLDMEGYDITIDKEFYFANYIKMCKHLLSKLSATYKNEVAKDVQQNILTTDKTKYRFKYLIDCSGPSFFLRKLFNFPLPFKYFIGKLHNLNVEPKCDDKRYFYFYSKSNGYVEDYYPLKNKVIHGDWWLSDDTNFDKIVLQDYDLAKRFNLDRSLITHESKVIEPISPVYPLSTKKFGFLGDSFGNATPATGQGVPFALDSSLIMSECIKKNDLISFQNLWEKKFMGAYQKSLAPKMNQQSRLVIINLLKDYPKILEKILSNEEVKLPGEILRKIPKKILFRNFWDYFRLKSKYFLMKNKIGVKNY